MDCFAAQVMAPGAIADSAPACWPGRASDASLNDYHDNGIDRGERIGASSHQTGGLEILREISCQQPG
jgi:hypothetical protein